MRREVRSQEAATLRFGAGWTLSTDKGKRTYIAAPGAWGLQHARLQRRLVNLLKMEKPDLTLSSGAASAAPARSVWFPSVPSAQLGERKKAGTKYNRVRLRIRTI